MSYDLYLVDPISRKTLELDAPHQMRGSTTTMGSHPGYMKITLRSSVFALEGEGDVAFHLNVQLDWLSGQANYEAVIAWWYAQIRHDLGVAPAADISHHIHAHEGVPEHLLGQSDPTEAFWEQFETLKITRSAA